MQTRKQTENRDTLVKGKSVDQVENLHMLLQNTAKERKSHAFKRNH